MAKARRIPGLSADEPYACAAAKIVEVRVAELIDHARGVLDVDDIERVHDMRVATRRLRAALEIFGPAFRARELKAGLRQVKELADALGERRDRDVSIAALEQIARVDGRARSARDRDADRAAARRAGGRERGARALRQARTSSPRCANSSRSSSRAPSAPRRTRARRRSRSCGCRGVRGHAA